MCILIAMCQWLVLLLSGMATGAFFGLPGHMALYTRPHMSAAEAVSRTDPALAVRRRLPRAQPDSAGILLGSGSASGVPPWNHVAADSSVTGALWAAWGCSDDTSGGCTVRLRHLLWWPVVAAIGLWVAQCTRRKVRATLSTAPVTVGAAGAAAAVAPWPPLWRSRTAEGMWPASSFLSQAPAAAASEHRAAARGRRSPSWAMMAVGRPQEDMHRDYYADLGVSPVATAAEIKSAFRQKARAHHPDVNAGAHAAQLFMEARKFRRNRTPRYTRRKLRVCPPVHLVCPRPPLCSSCAPTLPPPCAMCAPPPPPGRAPLGAHPPPFRCGNHRPVHETPKIAPSSRPKVRPLPPTSSGLGSFCVGKCVFEPFWTLFQSCNGPFSSVWCDAWGQTG